MYSENRSIDFSTVTGIFLAFLIIALSIKIGSGHFFAFVDPLAFLIVVGGTLLVVLACFSFQEIFAAFPGTFNMVCYHMDEPHTSAIHAISQAEYIRKKGLNAAARDINVKKDESFFYKALGLVQDRLSVEQIEKILYDEIITSFERHSKVVSILRKAAEISPAMGLIGTLVGLVQMLGNLNDVSKIGPAMAVALLTTFYGAMVSYMIFYPLASKVERNAKEEIMSHRIYQMAAISIAKNENPRELEIKINSLLSPSNKVYYFD